MTASTAQPRAASREWPATREIDVRDRGSTSLVQQQAAGLAGVRTSGGQLAQRPGDVYALALAAGQMQVALVMDLVMPTASNA